MLLGLRGKSPQPDGGGSARAMATADRHAGQSRFGGGNARGVTERGSVCHRGTARASQTTSSFVARLVAFNWSSARALSVNASSVASAFKRTEIPEIEFV